jgi:hypothetical protein
MGEDAYSDPSRWGLGARSLSSSPILPTSRGNGPETLNHQDAGGPTLRVGSRRVRGHLPSLGHQDLHEPILGDLPLHLALHDQVAEPLPGSDPEVRLARLAGTVDHAAITACLPPSSMAAIRRESTTFGR